MMYSEAFNHSPACQMMEDSNEGKVFCICTDDVSKSVLVPFSMYHRLFNSPRNYGFIPGGDYYVFAVYDFETLSTYITPSIADAVNYWDMNSNCKSLYYVDTLNVANAFEAIHARSVNPTGGIKVLASIKAAVKAMYD